MVNSAYFIFQNEECRLKSNSNNNDDDDDDVTIMTIIAIVIFFVELGHFTASSGLNRRIL
jgi:hypothetical protein